MPDFPPVGGASAADVATAVWANATRALTDKAGFTISGTKTTLDALNDIAADDVWDVGTRALTDKAGFTLATFTGQPRTDLLGDDHAFAVATSTRIANIDRLANVPALEPITEASILMDTTAGGVEKTLVEKTDTKQAYLEGDVDLTAMQAGDTIRMREYMKIKDGGGYIMYADYSYSDVQSVPLQHVTSKANKRSIKITATQTAGTARTLDVSFERKSQATAT